MRRSPVFGAGLMVVLALPAGSAPAHGQEKPADRQIIDAVSPLPEQMRGGAAVLGYRNGRLTELRAGTNAMICLADDPAREGFHTACYHASLEPFMARGRELRGRGLESSVADSMRLAEMDAGTLPLPEPGASLYSLTNGDDAFDPRTATTRGLWVLYLPYATEASIGMSALPARDRPWLMSPGKPTAHVMIARPAER